ncbi:cold-regulated protein 28-like isoform X1 [Hibiscus syriacus]|uniref:cold-regulated protein 28-like isoform X1 n=1 Tax=Hibiscus syriacus TaxID=106335 RepID=UPI00192485CD|nr:cold-regulated protein 28-like isoform X1 [Hibiscus syriacus]
MEHNLRLNFPAPAPDPDPLACLNELTQTNSESSASGVTIESFRDPTANATPQGETMVWTNKKHDSYLGFLEASFVKQLHYSNSLRGCHPREEMWEPCPTQFCAEVHNSSHQFLALQGGRYQKSYDPLLDSTADSRGNRESLLHHFTSEGKRSSKTFSLSRETLVADGGTYSRSDMSLGGCTTVVSDQNFVDEDQREKTSCVSRV